MLVLLAHAAFAAPSAGDPSKLLGTYECNNGSATATIIGQQPRIETYTAERPMLRVTLASTAIKSKPQLFWWNEKEKSWKQELGTELAIKEIEVTEKYWSITFDGTFGDRLPAYGTAMLSFISSSVPTVQVKPNLIISQYAPMFSGAAALECDKL